MLPSFLFPRLSIREPDIKRTNVMSAPSQVRCADCAEFVGRRSVLTSGCETEKFDPGCMKAIAGSTYCNMDK